MVTFTPLKAPHKSCHFSYNSDLFQTDDKKHTTTAE